jgi:hypothetical protein
MMVSLGTCVACIFSKPMEAIWGGKHTNPGQFSPARGRLGRLEHQTLPVPTTPPAFFATSISGLSVGGCEPPLIAVQLGCLRTRPAMRPFKSELPSPRPGASRKASLASPGYVTAAQILARPELFEEPQECSHSHAPKIPPSPHHPSPTMSKCHHGDSRGLSLIRRFNHRQSRI